MPVKNQFRAGEFLFGLEQGGTKFEGCALKHFLQSITRVRVLTVLSKQNKFHFYCLLLSFMSYYFRFFVFCSFVILFCFGTCEFLLHYYLYIGLVRHFIHLDQITLGFVDVRASEKNIYKIK